KRQLNGKIKDKKIKKVEVRLRKIVKYPLKKFKKIVEGSKIINIARRAKLLIIELSNGYDLVIHLKLTGQLIFNGQINKYSHLIYYFTDGDYLLHNDLRQFGFVKVVPQKKLNKFLAKENFGPEPLEKNFTLDLFKRLLAKKPKAKIKPLLMDQTFIAGLGNIYSDEVLFYAKVKPIRIVKTLKPEEIKKIYQGIKKILPKAIKRQGTSVDMYLTAEGKEGTYASLLKVYGRCDEPCFVCKTRIKRLKLGGRSAHFCPKCQK
ncbi:MAG: DNA-formamidopyrimidine glycosylase, partial [Candidatus Portnoybacteria bacterium RIFCSPHIGHO2_12_FULL_40_11]